MNKVKIMLLLIGVSMLGGGVLAFKASRIGATHYCINPNVTLSRCPIGLANASFPPGSMVRYTVTTDPSRCTAPCPDGTPCHQFGGQPGL